MKFGLRLINNIGEISTLPAHASGALWPVIIALAWVGTFGLVRILFVVGSTEEIFDINTAKLCEKVECIRPQSSDVACPTQAANSDVGQLDHIPKGRRVYWSACESASSALLTVLLPSSTPEASDAEQNENPLSPVNSDAGGARSISFAFVGSGSGEKGVFVKAFVGRAGQPDLPVAHWDLIKVGRKFILDPGAAPLNAPFPVEYLSVAVKSRVREAAGQAGIDPQLFSEVAGELAEGLKDLDLADRTNGVGKYWFARSVSGPIQSITILLFFIFLVIYACRAWVNIHELKSGLKREEAEMTFNSDVPGSATFTDAEQWVTSLEHLDRMSESSSENSLSSSATIGDIATTAVVWARRGTPRELIPELVTLEQDAIQRMWELEYQPLRYIIWAIPSVGFIGTVVGVGDAMLKTSSLASPDQETKMMGRGEVASGIGVAFDTTLVALVLAIIANFLLHDLVAREASGLQRVRDLVVSLVSGIRLRRPLAKVKRRATPTRGVVTHQTQPPPIPSAGESL